jgi:hypothetical protein
VAAIPRRLAPFVVARTAVAVGDRRCSDGLRGDPHLTAQCGYLASRSGEDDGELLWIIELRR